MSLRIWLPLDGNTINKGDLGSKLSESGITFADNGKIGGKCFSGGYISMTPEQSTSILNNNELTIAFWIKPLDKTKNNIIFGDNNNRQFSLFQYYNSSSDKEGTTLHWSWGGNGINSWLSGMNYDENDTPSSNTQTILPSVMPEKLWTHVCVVYKNPSLYIYINGKLRAVRHGGVSNAASFAQTTPIIHNSSYRYFNDFRIYNHALSLKEIKELSKGLMIHYKLNFDNNTNLLVNALNPSFTGQITQANGIIAYDSLLRKNVYECSNTTTEEKYIYYSNRFKVEAGQTYTFSCDAYKNNQLHSMEVFLLTHTGDPGNTSSSYSQPVQSQYPTLKDNEWTHVKLQFTVPNNHTTGYIRIDNNGSKTNGEAAVLKVVNMKLTKGTRELPLGETMTKMNNHLYEYDNSGYGYHATKVGNCTPCNESIRYGACTLFPNGLNDYIQSPEVIAPTDAVTLMCWIKGASAGLNSYHIPICFKNPSLPDGRTYELSIDSQGHLRGGFVINGSRRCETTNHTSILDNKWHLVAVSYDGNNIKHYVDGKYVQPSSTDAQNQLKITGTISNNHGYWILGNYYSGNYGNSNLQVSDVRVYSTSLLEQDIQTIYQASQSLDRQGQEYVSEINEQEYTHNNGIGQNGIHNINYLSEIVELDDGSQWIQITNHNNYSGANLFTGITKEQFEKTFVYKNDECWAAFPLIKSDIAKTDPYEFLAIEQNGNTDNILIRRWTQNKNPVDAIYTDVSDCVYNDNYNKPTATRKGLYRYHLAADGTTKQEYANTFLRIYNGTPGNWYGAFGSSEAWGGGIPGFDNATMGIFNLYMRIKPEAITYKEFKKGIVIPSTINEI